MPLRPAAAERIAQLTETKARIIECARDAVAEDGWQGAQIALVAERAQVATGSIYRYFESKADLFAQVLAKVSQVELDVVQAVIDSEGPASRRLAEAIRTFVKRAMQGRRLAYALIAEPCEPEIDVARLKYRAMLARQIAGVIAQGVKAGEFLPVDENIAASCITGGFMEALVGPLAPEAKPNSKAEAEIVASVAQLCVRMLSRPDPSLRAVPRR
jgi:AcrR family transcriptional regulator